MQSSSLRHGHDFSVAGRASAIWFLDETGKEGSDTPQNHNWSECNARVVYVSATGLQFVEDEVGCR